MAIEEARVLAKPLWRSSAKALTLRHRGRGMRRCWRMHVYSDEGDDEDEDDDDDDDDYCLTATMCLRGKGQDR